MIRKIDGAQAYPDFLRLRNLNERWGDASRTAVQMHLRKYDALVFGPKNIVIYRYSHSRQTRRGALQATIVGRALNRRSTRWRTPTFIDNSAEAKQNARNAAAAN